MESREKTVKSRNPLNHAGRIEKSIQKHLKKQQTQRVAKLSSSRFAPCPIDKISFQHIIESLHNHVPVTRDVILAIDNYCRTYTEDVVQFINDVDLARIIASALNNSINDTCSVTKDKFDNVETISDLLVSLSLGSHDMARVAFLNASQLVHFIASNQSCPPTILYNLFCVLGNVCLDNSEWHQSLLHLAVSSEIFSVSKRYSDVFPLVPTVAWFFSVYVHPNMELEFLNYSTSIAQCALCSEIKDGILQGLWLLRRLNEIAALNAQFRVPVVLILDALKHMQSCDSAGIEALLSVIGTTSTDHHQQFDREDLSIFLGKLLCIEDNGIHIAKIQMAFSILTKLIITLPAASFIQPNLVNSGSYTLHLEIIFFMDFLLLNCHPKIVNHIHNCCELIVSGMTYIFEEARDLEAVSILLEIILHELTIHPACSIAQEIMNTAAGEALDNLAATTDNAGIRSLCHKILSIVFDEEM